MPPINPLQQERADAQLKPIYEAINKKFGKMPNFFGMLAHKPEVLKNFIPFSQAIMAEGALEPRFKEFAYLKTSLTNGCEY